MLQQLICTFLFLALGLPSAAHGAGLSDALITPSVSISSPGGGAPYFAPAMIPVVATATAGTGATVSRVDFYAGPMLVGTAFSAPYTITWSGVAAGGYLLSAKVTDSLGASASSGDIPVTVVARTPPYVSLTAPDNLSTYTAPATIPIAAAASAGTGALVSRVDFFAGSDLVGSASATPYSFNWTGVGVGAYSLTAKVTDSLGDTASSSDLSVTVLPTTPASVTLTTPAAGASYDAPASIQMTAAASAGTGATVQKVEFYAGSTLAGTATSAPFSVIWSNVAAGTYSVTAKATDSLGGTATSTPISVTVKANGGGEASLVLTQDIGSVAQKGSGSYLNGTYTLKGAGSDIWGNADGFRFGYRPMIGDGQIVARVTSLENTSPWAKAGVMIRQSLTANSMHAMMDVTPGNGAEFSSRTAIGGSTTVTAIPNITAPYWVKLLRSGNTLTGYVSSNGSNWQQVGSNTVRMSGILYIGLVVSSHSADLCSATMDNVQ